MIDGCTFLGFKISTPIHCHHKAFFFFKYNSYCIRLKAESHLHLEWFGGEFFSLCLQFLHCNIW